MARYSVNDNAILAHRLVCDPIIRLDENRAILRLDADAYANTRQRTDAALLKGVDMQTAIVD